MVTLCSQALRILPAHFDQHCLSCPNFQHLISLPPTMPPPPPGRLQIMGFGVTNCNVKACKFNILLVNNTFILQGFHGFGVFYYFLSLPKTPPSLPCPSDLEGKWGKPHL